MLHNVLGHQAKQRRHEAHDVGLDCLVGATRDELRDPHWTDALGVGEVAPQGLEGATKYKAAQERAASLSKRWKNS